MGDIIRLTNPRCDEPEVDGVRLPAQPVPLEPPRPVDDNAIYGPNATFTIKRNYVQVFYGSPNLASLTQSQALLYGYVRSFNDTGKRCRASMLAIAEACQISPSTVKRCIQQLCSHKYGRLLRKVNPRRGRISELEARREI